VNPPTQICQRCKGPLVELCAFHRVRATRGEIEIWECAKGHKTTLEKPPYAPRKTWACRTGASL
jgi:hypothetical protein